MHASYTCKICKGSGKRPSTVSVKCQSCEGDIPLWVAGAISIKCLKCGEVHRYDVEECVDCSGRGNHSPHYEICTDCGEYAYECVCGAFDHFPY